MDIRQSSTSEFNQCTLTALGQKSHRDSLWLRKKTIRKRRHWFMLRDKEKVRQVYIWSCEALLYEMIRPRGSSRANQRSSSCSTRLSVRDQHVQRSFAIIRTRRPGRSGVPFVIEYGKSASLGRKSTGIALSAIPHRLRIFRTRCWQTFHHVARSFESWHLVHVR
jgi:hypothetical protein